MKVNLSTPALPDHHIHVVHAPPGWVVRLEHPSHAFDDEKYAYWIKVAPTRHGQTGTNLLNLMTGKLIHVNDESMVTVHEARLDVQSVPLARDAINPASKEPGSP